MLYKTHKFLPKINHPKLFQNQHPSPYFSYYFSPTFSNPASLDLQIHPSSRLYKISNFSHSTTPTKKTNQKPKINIKKCQEHTI